MRLQPSNVIEQIRVRLEEEFEYTGHNLGATKLRTQIGLALSQRRHTLLHLIRTGAERLHECSEEHWEGLMEVVEDLNFVQKSDRMQKASKSKKSYS